MPERLAITWNLRSLKEGTINQTSEGWNFLSPDAANGRSLKVTAFGRRGFSFGFFFPPNISRQQNQSSTGQRWGGGQRGASGVPVLKNIGSSRFYDFVLTAAKTLTGLTMEDKITRRFSISQLTRKLISNSTDYQLITRITLITELSFLIAGLKCDNWFNS